MKIRRSAAAVVCAFLTLLVFVAGNAKAQLSAIVDSVNANLTPPFLSFANANAGWVVVPTRSYLLSGIYSTFRNVGSPTQQGPVLPRSVQLSVFDTNAQGALLARTSFNADGSGGNLGGNFAAVLLVAGRKYFVAYDNIYNIGLNIVDWMPAQAAGTVNLEGWYTGENYSSHHAKNINGVLQVFSAPILRLHGEAVSTLASSDCLFDWAERNYPQLFAPAGRPSLTLQTYYYRYYPGTKSYVGISAADGNVYYLSPAGVLQNVGALAGWLTTAGCPQPR